MNILISSNDRYVMPTMVMLTSFFASNPEDGPERHRVWMLESGLSDGENERIASLVRGAGGEYTRLRIPEDVRAVFADAATRPHISRETYYRLLAPVLLPENLDRILWLDGDIIVRQDIRGFYGLPFGDKLAAACGYGPAMLETIRANASCLGLASPDTYFNAGVMLLNLPMCRGVITADYLAGAAASWETGRYLFPGQDVVNLVFDGRVRIEDYRRYNCMIHCIAGEEDLRYARRHAAAVHFPGEAKPWKFDDIHFADEWLLWYRRCFGEEAELRRMSYFRLKALFNRQGKQAGRQGKKGL